MIQVRVEATYEDIVSEIKFFIAYMKEIPEIPQPTFQPLPELDDFQQKINVEVLDVKEKFEIEKTVNSGKTMELKGGWNGWKQQILQDMNFEIPDTSNIPNYIPTPPTAKID